MSRAVRFERYGGVEVLEVAEVEPPQPDAGQLLLRVRAAGLNPFDTKLRSGMFEQSIPVTFPTLQGNDVAGVVEQVGAEAGGFAVGDEVLGATSKRGAQAELAVIPVTHALMRPAGLSWEVAGGLWTVATTAYATVASVGVSAGDVVLVTGAAGAVGGLASQLALKRGATVIAVASESSHDWLRSRGIVPVAYDATGESVAERVARASAASGPPTALLDNAGHGYVALALELGIEPQRINTLADYAAVDKYGVRNDGRAAADTVEVMAEIVELMLAGELELPIAASFPLERVRDAYTLLENGHPPGKIVLEP